jgi:hypothetical protein
MPRFSLRCLITFINMHRPWGTERFWTVVAATSAKELNFVLVHAQERNHVSHTGIHRPSLSPRRQFYPGFREQTVTKKPTMPTLPSGLSVLTFGKLWTWNKDFDVPFLPMTTTLFVPDGNHGHDEDTVPVTQASHRWDHDHHQHVLVASYACYVRGLDSLGLKKS